MIIDGNGDLSERFVSMQKSLGIDFAIEVGAHAAEFSQEISRLLNIRSLAIEANPHVFYKYNKNILDNRILYLNYAVSDKNGTVDLLVHEDTLAGNNSIKIRLGEHDFKKYSVKAYTLDSLLEEMKISFNNAALWVDCEGANREVLVGALNTLPKCSSIFIETENRDYWQDQWLTSDVIDFLESNGFYMLASEKIYEAQRNIIFVRKDN
jgi:FkbM family methyltransferase